MAASTQVHYFYGHLNHNHESNSNNNNYCEEDSITAFCFSTGRKLYFHLLSWLSPSDDTCPRRSYTYHSAILADNAVPRPHNLAGALRKLHAISIYKQILHIQSLTTNKY